MLQGGYLLVSWSKEPYLESVCQDAGGGWGVGIMVEEISGWGDAGWGPWRLIGGVDEAGFWVWASGCIEEGIRGGRGKYNVCQGNHHVDDWERGCGY